MDTPIDKSINKTTKYYEDYANELIRQNMQQPPSGHSNYSKLDLTYYHIPFNLRDANKISVILPYFMKMVQKKS